MPGVSRNAICALSGNVRIPMMRLRVVWGFGVTIDTLAPTSAFSKVDFPTFGRPRMATYPVRCATTTPPSLEAEESRTRDARCARSGDARAQAHPAGLIVRSRRDDDGHGRGAFAAPGRRQLGESPDRGAKCPSVGGDGRSPAARGGRGP